MPMVAMSFIFNLFSLVLLIAIKSIYTGIDSDLFFFVEKMAVCLFS